MTFVNVVFQNKDGNGAEMELDPSFPQSHFTGNSSLTR